MIVSFEVAKIAKEKGYVEYSEWLYNEDGGKPKRVGNYNNVEDDPCWLTYSAPYQFELQKWLREEHNINIEVIRQVGINDSSYIFYVATVQLNNKKRIVCTGKKIYEEALEAGIICALNLIK